MAMRSRDPNKAAKGDPHVVIRRCPVCDWKGAVIVGMPREEDCPQCHAPTVAEAPPKTAKNPHAAALGRLGGKRGGRARAKKLSPARRKQIARKAALARWRKTR
jgi:hypothetical protein